MLSLSTSGDEEHPSLEYIDDPYFPKLPQTATPSLDELHYDDRALLFDDDENDSMEWSPEAEQYLRSMPLDQIFTISDDYNTNTSLLSTNSSDLLGDDDLQKVEAELLGNSLNNNSRDGDNNSANRNNNGEKQSRKFNEFIRNLFVKKSMGMRDVRVTFIDFSKPYLAKISSSDNYKQFLNIGNSPDDTESLANIPQNSVEFRNKFAKLSDEEQEHLRAKWKQELQRVEEEIVTIRTVLQSKAKYSTEVKRKLGITVWKEFREEFSSDMNQGIKSVKESSVFQKTESALKRTTTFLDEVTSNISSKFTQMKKSDSYRSLEEKVGNAYGNVKTKVGSRSESSSSIDDSPASTPIKSATTGETE